MLSGRVDRQLEEPRPGPPAKVPAPAEAGAFRIHKVFRLLLMAEIPKAAGSAGKSLNAVEILRKISADLAACNMGWRTLFVQTHEDVLGAITQRAGFRPNNHPVEPSTKDKPNERWGASISGACGLPGGARTTNNHALLSADERTQVRSFTAWRGPPEVATILRFPEKDFSRGANGGGCGLEQKTTAHGAIILRRPPPRP